MTVRCTSPVEGVAATALYEALDGQGQPVDGPQVVLLAVMHGDEPVGLGVLEEFEASVDANLITGSVLTVRCNLAAHAINQRHTPDGVDMNRQWTPSRLAALRAADPSGLCAEERRVVELAPLLLGKDAILDLHSTSRPSPPCLIFRDDQRNAALAMQLGVHYLVTGLHEAAILDGGMASNVGLEAGEASRWVGFTFEAGQHTAPGNEDRAWEITHRLLFLLGVWAAPPPPTSVRPRVYEVMERFRQAPAGTTPFRFVGYRGGEPGSVRQGPERLLESFEEVEADEIILRRGHSHVARAQSPFTMTMPCPTAAPGTDLYYITQRRYGFRTEAMITDEQAAREAAAVERIMDLVSDDQLVAGTTWISFDSRQALDLCAELVGRCLRLEHDDPHRRITIVGRGDWGGDEAEQRAGQRYRQAMRDAMASDVPILRVQLLRGAALGWLDALTSPTMSALLAARMASGDDTLTHVGLQLSVRQPSTVSLLVIGDLEHGIATGDTRHLRIAVLVEAATAEADPTDVHVRVVRAGLVSARPELIRATASLLAARADEHRALIQGPLAAVRGLEQLTLADGTIEAQPDPRRLDGLREVLRGFQLGLWCDLLQHEISAPIIFDDEGELNRWLATAMAGTGILDVSSLRTLLVRREHDAWVVDPDYLLAVMDDPEEFSGSTVRRRATSPRQPLWANQVNADNLERWLGWKRFLRTAQSIPGTRGKDLDLAYEAEDIQRRLARWMRGARKLAQRSSRQVMVVLAGDGLSPLRERHGTAWDVVLAHRALVNDPHVRYLRIQNARGTQFSWMKDLIQNLAQRPQPGQPVALQWEEEHGATVNVVLVAERDSDDPLREDPWSLDGWTLRNCGILMSGLHGRGRRDYQLALFTEPLAGAEPNAELLHFGRAHCEGLLQQAGLRVWGEQGAPSADQLEDAVVHQIARWIERVRGWGSEPAGPEAAWVARELGLADSALAEGLATHRHSAEPAVEAARELWAAMPAWPGPLWKQLRVLD